MDHSPVVDEERVDGAFRAALEREDFASARAQCEQVLAGPGSERWLVTGMLEDLALRLAGAGRLDESIATFERAIELGWDAVPDGRCEIARVLLLAGRHSVADALWGELRASNPEEVWTLNAGGLAYCEVERYEEALDWLTPALRLELDRDDAERIVDQLSDARHQALQSLGRGLDELEEAVESFRRSRARRGGAGGAYPGGRSAGRTATTRAAGVGGVDRVAWIAASNHDEARRRSSGWSDGLVDDAPFPELAARMERYLRDRRADGDGPITVVTIDLEGYQDWCASRGHDPADRRSRGTYASEMVAAGEGVRWPPGRNEPCWCGSARKYKRCCPALR